MKNRAVLQLVWVWQSLCWYCLGLLGKSNANDDRAELIFYQLITINTVSVTLSQPLSLSFML